MEDRIFLTGKALSSLGLRNKEIRKLRAEWSIKQSLEENERQIRGEDITLAGTVSSMDNMTPAQQKMLDALRVPLINKHDAQVHRRAAAIKSPMAYCLEEEQQLIKIFPNPRRPNKLASQSSPTH